MIAMPKPASGIGNFEPFIPHRGNGSGARLDGECRGEHVR